jgi:hypothetical protein
LIIILHFDIVFSYLLFTLPIFLNKFPESFSYYVLRKQGDKLANILNQIDPKHDGYIVHLKYHELDKPVNVRDHFHEISPLLRLSILHFSKIQLKIQDIYIYVMKNWQLNYWNSLVS